MKRKFLLLMLALIAMATTARAQVVLSETNFPDANFRAALALILGISEGDEITAEKIAATTSLYCDGYGKPDNEKIADLTGIEHFTALTSLHCGYNNLTTFDVSKNVKLEYLSCMMIPLASLDLSKNTELLELRLWSNQLTELDLSNNTKLEKLEFGNFANVDFPKNEVSSLNLSKNTALRTMNFQMLGLTSLDVSKNTALTELYCNYNQLTALDVSKNTALTELYCRNNQLTALDVSKNTALEYLNCSSNQLTSLDVSQNTALTNLDCYNNKLTSLDVSKNTALTRLDCDNNQLTSIDVSKNTALEYLNCSSNQLTSFDVSKNTALRTLYCHYNELHTIDVSKNYNLETLGCGGIQLTSLDISKNEKLSWLYCVGNQLTTLDLSNNKALKTLRCSNNQLTTLDISKNPILTEVSCYSNLIKDESMWTIVATLPTVSKGQFFVIDTKDGNEGNVCTKSQVAVAKGKGWTVYDYNGHSNDSQEYEGSDPVEEDINPVDEDDNIDFGSDMDENDNLNGNVIGDIFYNIGNGNGEYNAEEGCIVLKKTTDDETVDGLSGKDIFGEDFKGQFTGIVFKVPSGKGTVKVTAETTGNMLLKVKIGNNDPVEMELNGKLKISFPYNVSETTLVAIYAGAANEAKGFGTTNDAEDAALKIYGIEFIRDETTAIDASLKDNGKMINDNYYSIDGVKLNGEPTKKGIYIRNGKKVKK